jgi:nitroimidazol reductase NimA-like FMN-containing flavoprotein (pyridoxamine 5'-phosphate oxidase superfamily)
MNYGYAVTKDKLLIFVHSGKTGYKLRLMEKHPLVCCSFSAFRNYPDREYKGHVHDFRSVMAFGKIRKLDLRTETEDCKAAIHSIFEKAHRTSCKNPKGMKAIDLYVIECDWEDVSGKTESPVRKPEDVPFVDVYNVEPDDEPYDDEDLYRDREDKIRNRRYLGYLKDDE